MPQCPHRIHHRGRIFFSETRPHSLFFFSDPTRRSLVFFLLVSESPGIENRKRRDKLRKLIKKKNSNFLPSASVPYATVSTFFGVRNPPSEIEKNNVTEQASSGGNSVIRFSHVYFKSNFKACSHDLISVLVVLYSVCSYEVLDFYTNTV